MRRGLVVVVSVLSLSVAAVPPAAPQDADAIVYSTYRFGGRHAGAAIFTIVPDGERVRLTGSRSFNLRPVWSPDRSRVAYVRNGRRSGNAEIWVMDADGTDKVRLTTGRRSDHSQRWSPDGTHIAWVKAGRNSSASRIYVMRADGSDKTAVTSDAFDVALPAWSPDGRWLAYAAIPNCADCPDTAEIHRVDALTGEDHRVLTNNDVDDTGPEWSPDGSSIVFTSEREDGGDLYTMTPEGMDPQPLTDLDGYAFLPEWSPDGSEIAFTVLVDADNFNTRVGVVDVDTREDRFLTDVATGGILPAWSRDGARIAFLGFHDGANDIGVIDRDGTDPGPVTRSKTDEGWLDW